jgi:hypothetical protein
MTDYRETYREMFEDLGRPLRKKDGTPASEIRRAEKRLGVVAPIPLKEFYAVAGRACDFHSANDRFLPPDRWEVVAGKLVFLEENQAVVIYGTALEGNDPPAYMAVNDEPVRWMKETPNCSNFLLVTLCWAAAYGGGVAVSGWAPVGSRFRKVLDEAWGYVGTVNRMRAYRREGATACFLKWTDRWQIHVAARDAGRLEALSTELGLNLTAAGC